MNAPRNTTVTVFIGEDAPGDVMAQLISVRVGAMPAAPVKVGSIRLSAGRAYKLEVCPGVSLSLSHVERKA